MSNSESRKLMSKIRANIKAPAILLILIYSTFSHRGKVILLLHAFRFDVDEKHVQNELPYFIS